MKKRQVFILCFVVLAGSMVFGAGKQDVKTSNPRLVRLAADGFLLGTQSWVAKNHGFFEDEGLKAEVSLFGTGIEAIQAVIAQQADLGPGLDFAVLNLAAAAGKGMEVVACIAAPLPGFHKLAVRKNINSPKDLIGKKIGYVQGTSENLVTVTYLQQNGISLDQVQLIPFPGLFEMVGALRTDNIQASWVWLSGVQEAEKDENLKILTDDSAVLDTLSIYLVTRSDWASKNQDIIESVIRAYDKASKVINADPEAAAKIVADSVSGNAKMFASLIPRQNFRIEFTQVQLDSFDSIAKFLINSGKLRPDFDIRNFINFKAMEAAVPGSVKVQL